MKQFLIFLLSFFLLASLMLAVALYVPTSLPVHSDFSALYNTSLALVHRVPIYDLEAVEAVAVEASGIPPEKFFLARFPYPPWYALSTFYLGLLPPQAAATLWFEINLVMLFLSVWFLTDGWPGRLRLIAFPLALFFLPVLGALSVGQYGFPVLLGASILIYSLRRENITLTTLGAVLLTFKPHIGALVLLSVLVRLIYNGDNFGRRALRSIVVAGILLFLAGFLAGPAWVVSYLKMLLNYQGEGNVASCSECASLPVFLSRWFLDGSLKQAAVIAVVLLIALGILSGLIRGPLLRAPGYLIASALLVTLLVSPYLYNYDFILLLVPFAVLAGMGNTAQKMVVVLCYVLPTVAIAVYSREGNVTLLAVASVLIFLLYLHAKMQVDVPARASYNTNNRI
jgi:hypothetical protein